MPSLFGPPLNGNTGITGQGMPNANLQFPGVTGQAGPRRNRRPDTLEEMYADALARGETPQGPAPGADPSIFDTQIYRGNNWGTGEGTRAGTFLGQGAYDAYGNLYNQGQDLYNQYGQMVVGQSGLSDLVKQVGDIRSGVLAGRMPQFAEQMIDPYLKQGMGKIQSGVTTAMRQASDYLPRAAAAEAISGAINEGVRGGADLYSSLYSPIAQQLVSDALGAGKPETLANLLGGQANLLGQQGNILGQQYGLPATINQNLLNSYNQRYLGQLAAKGGGK